MSCSDSSQNPDASDKPSSLNKKSSRNIREGISHPLMAQAVDHIDNGDVQALKNLLEKSPELVRIRVEGDGYEKGYFKNPTLLNFVAYNPWNMDKWKTSGFEVPDNIIEVTQVLLDAGADPNAVCGEEPQNQWTTLGLVTSGSPLVKASKNIEMLECLIKGGTDPNSGVAGAVSYAQWEMLDALIKHGAEKTPEVLAAVGTPEELKKSLKGVEHEMLHKALYVAVTKGKIENVKVLLAEEIEVNSFLPYHSHGTALHHAALYNQLEILLLLVDHGGDVQIKDTAWDADVISWAGHNGHSGIVDHFVLEKGYPATPQQMAAWNLIQSLTDWLKKNPGQVDAIGDWGTCLQQAAYHGHVDVIKLLIKYGADVNKSEGGDKVPGPGTTPLAKAMKRDHKEAVELLKKHGAKSDL